MSGGHFDYDQYKIGCIVDSIEQIIQNNKNLKEPEIPFSDEVLSKFKEGIKVLRIAQIYAQYIDWLLEGDLSEESFLEMLQNDIITKTEER